MDMNTLDKIQLLAINECQQVSAGKFKFHFNVVLTVFSAIGATIVAGPAAGGAIVAAAIATQGVGNLNEMAQQEQWNFGGAPYDYGFGYNYAW